MKAVIIGAGFISDFHAHAYRNMEGVTLEAICDIDPERAQAAAQTHACAAYTDADEMFKALQPDLVSVCVPTFLHESYVLQALTYGAHVLCEKPLALTMEACHRMNDAAKKAHRVLMVGQVLRWWPEYMQIKEKIEHLGTPSFIATQRLQYASRCTWLTDPNKGGGVLFDLFVHDLDFLCSLMGYDAAIESAWGMQGDEGSWRSLCVALRWPNGTGAVLQSSNMMPKGFPFTASLRADYPSACLHYQFNAPVNIQADAKTDTLFRAFENGSASDLPYMPGAQSLAFQNEISTFVNGVKTGVSPLPCDDTLKVMQLIHSVKERLENR